MRSAIGLHPLGLGFQSVAAQVFDGSAALQALAAACSMMSDGVGVRDVDCVAARHLDSCGTGTFGHLPLGRRRDHPVIRGDEVPARPDLPGRRGNLAFEGSNAPRDLRRDVHRARWRR